jgi:hypothetical protein
MMEADRDKLVKILRMFGSNHDGEVAAAARRAHQLVKSRSLDWDDLIIAIGGGGRQEQARPRYERPPPPPSDDDEAGLIKRCSERAKALSEWETEFIESISASIIEWGRLTPRQRASLDRIVNKLKVRGLWDDI